MNEGVDQRLDQNQVGQLKQQIIGHEKLFSQWSLLLERQQITGSFLFVGPAGVGKRKSAWSFIQQTLCEKRVTFEEACGHCGACRRVASHQHESVLFVEPDGAFIKVEQGQEILHFVQLQSLSRHRFVLIDEAHRMNAAVANALLKTLEESVDGTTFILLAPSLTSVLPTIRSRLRVFHFQPVPLDQIRSQKAVPEWALEASLGRFNILEALGTTEERQFRTQWADFFIKLMLSPNSLTEDGWRESLKNKEELRLALDLWLKLVRDALLMQQGETKSLLTLDLNPQLQKLASLSEDTLQKIGAGLIEMQKEMNFNKDAVLSLESLYIQVKQSASTVKSDSTC